MSARNSTVGLLLDHSTLAGSYALDELIQQHSCWGRIMPTKRLFCSMVASILILVTNGLYGAEPPYGPPAPVRKPTELKFKCESFTFVRVRHSDKSAKGVASKRWMTDYPDSERNLLARFTKDTEFRTDPAGKVLSLTDRTLNQYHFIYI